jgi:DNA-directed RNA polymerase subunit RPC12/RpoP
MPGKTIIVCEICGESIGAFNPDNIKIPIDGSMFESINPKREIPPPFQGSALIGWRQMRCPMCNNRPFLKETRIKTSVGYYHIKTKTDYTHTAELEKQ